MKPDYKNRMPRDMVYSFLFTFLGCAAAALGLPLPGGTLRTVLTIAFAVIAPVFSGVTVWAVSMY